MVRTLTSGVTIAWLVLFSATAGLWLLGQEEQQHATKTLGAALMGLAFFKTRIILLHFMELKNAPLVWRAIFEAWVIVVCAVVIGMYVLR